jgi:hypothetical protein
VNVIGQDRAGEDEVPALGNGACEAAGDGAHLRIREANRVVAKRGLLGAAQVSVVVALCEGSAGGYFGGAPIPEQFPGADEVGPGTPRVVGQPEPVGSEDQVVSEDHVTSSLDVVVSGIACGARCALARRPGAASRTASGAAKQTERTG